MSTTRCTRVYLQAEIDEALDRLARQRGISKASLIRLAALRYIAAEQDGGEDSIIGIIGLGHIGEKKMSFSRITVCPDQMGGVPCIRGLRIPVAAVVGMVADGMNESEILEAFPDLTMEDIHEALRYAAEAVREREIPLVTAG